MSCRVRFVVSLGLATPTLAIPSVPAALAQVYHVAEMNRAQIRALDRQRAIVIIPGGILEEHGPYLPSFTDGYQNEWLSQELAEAIVERRGRPVLIFPTVPLGVGSPEQFGGRSGFDGSFTVRPSTLRAVFMDLASALAERGFRWVFVIHMHGAPPHIRALDEAAQFFRDEYGGTMVSLTVLRSGTYGPAVPDFRTREEWAEDGLSVHAGVSETSRILFLRPALVDPNYITAPSYSAQRPEDLTRIAASADWPGYFGSPRLARADLGAQELRARASALIEFVIKILDGLEYGLLPELGEAGGRGPGFATLDETIEKHAQELQRRQHGWLRKKGLQ